MNTKALAAALVLLAPLSAAAQGPGPMTVERVKSGFLAAPDVKLTEFDHRALPLVGGYAGWVYDKTIFVGGGGYWLANNAHDREMAYGGLVVQWFARANERVGFSAKGLVGGGRATLGDTITEVIRAPGPIPLVNGRPDPSRMGPPTTRTVTVPVRFRQDFFVAEPEANVHVRVASFARLTGGVGYRLTAGEGHTDSRLSGAVASIGVQFGGGF